jgi:hypothetical protein
MSEQVGAAVGVGVAVGVADAVAVGVGSVVGVAVAVGSVVGVAVAVGVGVGGGTPAKAGTASPSDTPSTIRLQRNFMKRFVTVISPVAMQRVDSISSIICSPPTPL